MQRQEQCNSPNSTRVYCPRCRYEPTGIPRDHRCPARGFAFQQAPIHNLALGYAHAKLRAYTRVARLAAVAAALTLIALPVERLNQAPCVLYGLLVLAARGLAPDVVPAILLAGGRRASVFRGDVRAHNAGPPVPLHAAVPDDRWKRELERYRRGAWASILAASGALALTWW